MPKDDTVRLRHMLDAAQEAASFYTAANPRHPSLQVKKIQGTLKC